MKLPLELKIVIIGMISMHDIFLVCQIRSKGLKGPHNSESLVFRSSLILLGGSQRQWVKTNLFSFFVRLGFEYRTSNLICTWFEIVEIWEIWYWKCQEVVMWWIIWSSWSFRAVSHPARTCQENPPCKVRSESRIVQLSLRWNFGRGCRGPKRNVAVSWLLVAWRCEVTLCLFNGC